MMCSDMNGHSDTLPWIVRVRTAQVFQIGHAALFELAFTAGWSILASAFLINAVIAIRAMVDSGCLKQPRGGKRRKGASTSTSTSTSMGASVCCSTSRYPLWFWTCLMIPWVLAVVAVTTMVALDRRCDPRIRIVQKLFNSSTLFLYLHVVFIHKTLWFEL